MAITIEEAYDSRPTREGDSPSFLLRYIIRGTSSNTEAVAALGAESPSTYGTLARLNYNVDPVHVDTQNEKSCIWLGIAYYGSSRNKSAETGDSVIGFEISAGGTVRVKQSLETIARHAAAGETAPDLGGQINVVKNADGSSIVEGVDIDDSIYRWPERHYLTTAYVTADYRKLLFNLRGSVNQQAFRGFEAGEVMFMGATGGPRGDDDWEITFHFAAQPNLYLQTIGGITGINKRGWEYVWPYYGRFGEVAGQLVPVLTGIYVERTFKWGTFSQLGIGTA